MNDTGGHLAEGTSVGPRVAAGGCVELDDPREVAALLDDPARQSHIVQFYEYDGVLVENVARFLAAGLAAGESIIVVATEEHRRDFAAALHARGHDLAAAGADGRAALLDAGEALERVMDGQLPDAERFRALLDELIAQAGGVGRQVRIYGEVVDLLWRAGDRAAAIALESLWNAAGETRPFSLLCAYAMGNFFRADDRAALEQVCRGHGHVIPATLEQRVRSLEREVDERRTLEGALRDSLAREKQLRQEAERAVRFYDMFAGVLGHDLRNPLGAITMGANYIARSNVGDKATKAATRIVSSAERMARMIDQLLDFTRIRVGGGLALACTSVDLAEVCLRVKEELEAANPEVSIVLTIEGDCVGDWDHDRLLQVFSNLVGNAVAHGTVGQAIAIRVDGRAGDRVVVSVHNGGAVSPDVLPLIFEPFRGGAKLLGTQGLGLGGFITRQIVLAHHGEIEATSSATGTTMRVSLPRATEGC